MTSNKSKLIYTCMSLTAAAVALPLFAIWPGNATKRQKAPFTGRNYAHRGLHTRDKSVPENSLEAFRLASEMGYGVELDVQLSKDGYIVVFHDDNLERVCGVNAKVCDLNYSELKKLRLCGTEYGIPLFTDVIDTIDGRGPIICELKSGKRNRELCKKTYEILSNYKGEVCIESFNPMMVGWFRFHACEMLRGQLASQTADLANNNPLPLAIILSHLGMNFIARPQFIAYKIGRQPLSVKLNHLIGCMRVCWTSHEPRNEKNQDAVIFEYYKPKQHFK